MSRIGLSEVNGASVVFGPQIDSPEENVPARALAAGPIEKQNPPSARSMRQNA